MFRWSDASWLEDQDFWRLSGIFRDVFLYTVGQAWIDDYSIVTRFEEDYKKSHVEIEAVLSSYEDESESLYTIRGTLFDGEKALQSFDVAKDVEAKGQSYTTTLTIENPKLWSAEIPNLYMLVLEVKNQSGETVEYRSTRIGFRDVRIEQTQMLVNGKAVLLLGTNRHEFHPEKVERLILKIRVKISSL